MNDPKINLAYRDERDRSYGAAGMAISLVVMDGERYLAAVSLDNDDSEIIEMTHDFYAPVASQSARRSWDHTLRVFHLTTAMCVGNVLCRQMVHHRVRPALEVTNALRRMAVDEGRDTLQLEEEETVGIFNKAYNYLYHAFGQEAVAHLATDLSDRLIEQRRMSRSDLLEHLSALGLL